MKIWYKCVCDEHKEFIDLFVDTPTSGATQLYLKDKNQLMFDWLNLHFSCELRLVHRDDQIDFIFNSGYDKVNK